MFSASISFFILGIIALFLGANNVAGISIELGRILLGIFIVLSAVSLIYGLSNSEKNKTID